MVAQPLRDIYSDDYFDEASNPMLTSCPRVYMQIYKQNNLKEVHHAFALPHQAGVYLIQVSLINGEMKNRENYYTINITSLLLKINIFL
jgi:hypothetical protein